MNYSALDALLGLSDPKRPVMAPADQTARPNAPESGVKSAIDVLLGRLADWNAKPARDIASRLPAGMSLLAGELPSWIGGTKTLYHGSPIGNLAKISASPEAHVMDNAASRLGAFFSPVTDDAARYAGKAGRVYEANVPLKNAYEMQLSELDRLMDYTKGPDGKNLPFDLNAWNARKAELSAEADALREKLKSLGHDGIYVNGRGMRPPEVVSFNDIPVRR